MYKTLVISHSPVFFEGLKSIFKEDKFILSLEYDLGKKLIDSIKKITFNLIDYLFARFQKYFFI